MNYMQITLIGVSTMAVKMSFVVDIKASEAEILKVLDKHCLLTTDIKLVGSKSILLEVEALNIFSDEDWD